MNTAYVELNEQVGPAATREVAVRAGLPDTTAGLEDVLSNVLGTASPRPIDMAQVMATYAAQGVRVNSVHPGQVDTPILARQTAVSADRIRGRTPLGRPARTAEIADAVEYLLSDRASYVTGAALAVDGGYTAL